MAKVGRALRTFRPRMTGLCPWCNRPVSEPACSEAQLYVDGWGRRWHGACAEACAPGCTRA